jgi:hypothetical protein
MEILDMNAVVLSMVANIVRNFVITVAEKFAGTGAWLPVLAI